LELIPIKSFSLSSNMMFSGLLILVDKPFPTPKEFVYLVDVLIFPRSLSLLIFVGYWF